MQGLGSNGSGLSPSMGGIPPQLMALLMHGGAGGMGGGMTPGAAMMGGPQLPGGAGAMQHPQMPNPAPMMPPQQALQQQPGGAPNLGALTQPGAGGGPSPIAGLLAALKGQQNGLSPQQPPSAFGANGMLPAWLQAMLGGGAPMPQVPTAGPGGMMGGGV